MTNGIGNIFSNLPDFSTDKEIFETLIKDSHLKLERIISTGQTTPVGEWYDQSTDEWIILLKGNARLLFEDDTEQALSPGDYLFIPAHKKHRVSWTDPDETCVWLAVHSNTNSSSL